MVLWKKESTSADACYIDLLSEGDQARFADELLKLVCIVPLKNNDESTELRMRGNQLFKARNWREAMELYNKSLRYAHEGSENISLAYANRSVCFFQMQKYNHCLADIELAKKADYPERLMHKLKDREAACLKLMADGWSKPMGMVKPVLTLDAHEKLPGLANVLEVRTNDESVNHLVAKSDINVGEIVMVGEMFVSHAHCEDRTFCKTCLKPAMNFIPCPKCSDVMFCDDKCLASNNIHQVTCEALRCQVFDFVRVIESILIAVTAFPNASKLMEFVESALATRDLAIPKCESDAQAKYSMFLKMKFSEEEMNDELTILLLWSYHLLMKIPAIEQRFQSTHEKRFLVHLILQHDFILTCASSEFYDFDDKTDAKYLEISGIFLFQTMLKLSCIPNVSLKRHGNHVFAYAVRPVKKGDLLTTQNPHPIADGQCKCSKCAPKFNPENHNRLILEPDYQFVTQTWSTNYENSEKRPVLKAKLMNLLQKHGGLPWSKSIDCLVMFLDYCMQSEYCF